MMRLADILIFVGNPMVFEIDYVHYVQKEFLYPKNEPLSLRPLSIVGIYYILKLFECNWSNVSNHLYNSLVMFTSSEARTK